MRHQSLIERRAKIHAEIVDLSTLGGGVSHWKSSCWGEGLENEEKGKLDSAMSMLL